MFYLHLCSDIRSIYGGTYLHVRPTSIQVLSIESDCGYRDLQDELGQLDAVL